MHFPMSGAWNQFPSNLTYIWAPYMYLADYYVMCLTAATVTVINLVLKDLYNNNVMFKKAVKFHCIDT
jgi:hypothetical protein